MGHKPCLLMSRNDEHRMAEQLVVRSRSGAESGPREPRVLRRRQPVLAPGPTPARAKGQLRLLRPCRENAFAVSEQLDVVIRGAPFGWPAQDRWSCGSRRVADFCERDDFR